MLGFPGKSAVPGTSERMSGAVDETAQEPRAAGPDGLTDEQVAAHLKLHPDFLARHPDVLGKLAMPSRWGGDGILDMQQFMLERLRSEVDNLRTCALELIDTSRSNMSNQSRTHGAVLALIATDDIDHALRVMNEQWPILLDVDVVTIGFEPPPQPLPALVAAEIRPLAEGTARAAVGTGQEVALMRRLADDGTIFGAASGLVRSAALALLRPDGPMPVGLLALGSRVEEAFHPGQGTELLAFLARVVERCLRRCVNGAA